MSRGIEEVEAFLLSQGPYEREEPADPHRVRWRHRQLPWMTVSLTLNAAGRIPEPDFQWLVKQFNDEGGL